MKRNTIMVQGTTSDAGKSTLVAGICRVLNQQGYRVAPFKPQNMALNSAVTVDGGEIGRAQAVQAQACCIDAHTDMNPVLIKPSSDTGAQIIIQGHVNTDMDAKAFHLFKKEAMAAVRESHLRLSDAYEVVVVEGAGSPAEINLREGDIANMGFAEAVDCPVILVADIDKGGVFAHLVGTLELLSATEQHRVAGFVINKFRGDIDLLTPGLEWLEERTGKPVLGVLPYLHDFYLEAEDAIDTQQIRDGNANAQHERLNVVVPVFPRISNHTDFDALRHHPSVNLTYVGAGQTPPACDLLVLPGSKSVNDDYQWLIENGWREYIDRHLRYGGKVIGICGGFQMLGLSISDPHGVERSSLGDSCTIEGLGYLPITTSFGRHKTLQQKSGEFCLGKKAGQVRGYEIHHGVTQYQLEGSTPKKHVCTITYPDKSTDGVVSDDNQVFGCYLHGLFDDPSACSLILEWAGLHTSSAMNSVDMYHLQESQIERLAQSVEQHLDFQKIHTMFNRNESVAG